MTHKPPRCNLRAGLHRVAVLGLAVLWLTGCREAAREDAAIDRQTFVDTYVELRVAALRTPDDRLPAQERRRILDSLHVSEDDLLGFADVHGGDLDYMKELWNEVEQRLDSVPSPPAR